MPDYLYWFVLARAGCLIVASYGNEVNFEQQKRTRARSLINEREKKERKSSDTGDMDG